MRIGNKELLVVGDRVLIKQEDLEERTEVGLYLPQTVVEKEEVQGGRIVTTGPGIALAEVAEDDEPWRNSSNKEPRYIPLQAEAGDYALFLKKTAMEIKFEGEKYLIVSQASILVLVRDAEDLDSGDVLDEFEGLDGLDI